MEIIKKGHIYVLDGFEGYAGHQHLQFIEKRLAKSDGALATENDGTTNEEVLLVLIDRMNYLQGKLPSRENAIVITKLEESLMWLNKRTMDRQARGVEGKHKA